MRKVLMVKVNVLIENNRLQLEKKQKELQLAKKKQEKYSYSHYEQPSLQLLTPQKPLPHQRYATIDDPDTLFHMRFEELEKSNCRQQSIDQLQTEQYYLNRIMHELEGKIKGARRVSFQRSSKMNNSVLILPKVSPLPRDKENNDGRNYRLQKGEKQYILNCSQTESRADEALYASSELVHLQTEYAHLTAELAKMAGINSEPMEGSVTQMEKSIEEVNRLIIARKKEVNQLKADIASNSKVILKSKLTEDQQKCLTDLIANIQTEIFKYKIKNKGRNSFLKSLRSKVERKAQKYDQIEEPSITNMLSFPHQQFDVSPVQSTNYDKPVKNRTSKVKHLTTLQMQKQLPPEEEMTLLLKRKENVMKTIEADTKRFRQAYTDKMRKMVGGCNNMKTFQSLMDRLEESKEEAGVFKYRNIVTDS